MKLSAHRNPKSIAIFALIALASLITFALLAGIPSAQAQQPPDTDLNFPLPDSKNPPLGNLDSMLSRLVERVEQGISTANDAAASAPISRGESVAVTFYTQGDASSLADFLRSNGGDPRNIGEGYVEAYVPVALLVNASEQPGVIRVDAIVPPQPEGDMPLSPNSDSLETQNAPAGKGSVVSQGVALHGADAWHDAGYTGAGVKAGVIGDFSGFSALMGSELPANVTARCYTGVGEFSSNLADCEAEEGTYGVSNAETLLDIAPDVSLYISNPVSKGDVRDVADWMISQNVDVINMSTRWTWDGPGDGTSPSPNSPLMSVDAAVSGGAMWVTAAGNYAQDTWFGQFTDADGDNWLNFIGEDELNEFEIASGEKVRIQLRWDDSWTAADTDLDLYLFNANDPVNLVRADSSIDLQRGLSGDKPHEWINHTPTIGGKYGIAVRHWAGSAPKWVQLLIWSRSYVASIEYYTGSGSISNPAESANPGMLAVGAVNYWDTNTIAWYSSRGPTPDGRIKPDITSATCTQVASHSPFQTSNGQQCWMTSGTGYASPHVAGLAALVKDAYPAYSPQQIADYLKTHARPRGVKPNNDWGHGFARLPAPPSATTPVTGDLAGKVAALEQQMGALQRLMLNIQSLLQSLHDRLDSLEQGGGVAPVATPTATPTPSPTPTRVPAPSPAPTPVSNADCVQPIEPGLTSGTWTSGCVSANNPKYYGGDDYYAKFYTFTLPTTADVTITLSVESYATAPLLILLSGSGTDGDIMRVSSLSDSLTHTITATFLQPGSYTIEATSLFPGRASDFTIHLSINP